MYAQGDRPQVAIRRSRANAFSNWPRSTRGQAPNRSCVRSLGRAQPCKGIEDGRNSV